MPCMLCGDIIPTEVARCPACGAWSRRRDFRSLGIAVFMMLGFNAFVALGSGIGLLRLERLLRLATRDAYAPVPTGRTLTAYGEVFTASAALAGITGILYLAWLWRAYGHTPGPQPYARAWVVAGWLCPVVNLWIPARLVHAVWAGSGRGGSAERHWAAAAVTAWWTVLLGSLLLMWVFPGGGAGSLPEARFAVHLGIAATAGLALAAALCMVTVFQITRLQIDEPAE